MRRSAWLLLALLLPAAESRPQEAEVRLHTDSAIPRYLARGQELARAGQWDKMVDVLQRVVVGDPEVFPDLAPGALASAVYSDDGKVFYPAREFCLRELAHLPPEGLEAYRGAFDGKARDLFERAKSRRVMTARLAGYARVYEDFLVSSVGDDALEAAADLLLALGRFYEALGLYRRLLDVYPHDTDRDLAAVMAKGAYCAARIGDAGTRTDLLERLKRTYPDATVRIEGRPVPAREVAGHPRLALARGIGSGTGRDWPIAGGGPARTNMARDLPDDVARRPFWSFRIAERDARLSVAFGSWAVPRHDRGPAPAPELGGRRFAAVRPYPTVRPVVHGGVVFYKDYLEIVARRLSSGHLVPIFQGYHRLRDADGDPAGFATDPTQFTPPSLVRPGLDSAGKDAPRLEQVYRFFDYGGNALAIDGAHVFAAEMIELARPQHMLTEDVANQQWPRNMVAAYDRRSGKLLWGWNEDWCTIAVRRNREQFEAWRNDLQEHPDPYFRGPGVAANGILYTLAHEDLGEAGGGVALWAIDAKTGLVRFRTPLHFSDEARRRLPFGASLAVEGGTVYAVTDAGVVAAFDALPPGRVRWIRRYRRNFESGRPLGGGRVAGHVVQHFAYNDPVVAGGLVVVAAADAAELIALDAETGRLAWSIPETALGSLHHIVGVSRGVLVLAGARVMGFDLATGKPRWAGGQRELSGSEPFGRGFVGERYAYVPSRNRSEPVSWIDRFDLETGVPSQALRFELGKLGNLVHTGGRLVVANDEEVMCFTTGQAELARLDRRLKEEGERADARYERALVSLALDPPDRAAARVDFRKALNAPPARAASGAADALLLQRIRVAAIENLLMLAGSEDDLGAIEEARALVPPLSELAKGPPDFSPYHPFEAQLALVEAGIYGRTGRAADALAALEAFFERFAGARVIDRTGRLVDAPAAADALREELLAADEEFRRVFVAGIRERIRRAAADDDLRSLEEIPIHYGGRHPTEEAYFELARIHEQRGETARAEQVLREFLRRYPRHERRARVHLELARFLARRDLFGEARRERDLGASLLDGEGRRREATLLAELDRSIPAAGTGEAPRKVDLPLVAHPLARRDGTPVPIRGTLPPDLRDLVLLATGGGYAALDGRGGLLWERECPAGVAATPGPAGEPQTTVVASLIAAARFARAADGDLLLGDAGGLMRVDAKTGELRWAVPGDAATAEAQARFSFEGLRKDLALQSREGALPRRRWLPGHALAGRILIRVHPQVGVEAYDATTGALVWQNIDVKGPAAGPPQVLGQLLAVGWSEPGRVRIFDVNAGHEPVGEFLPGGTLLAPPVLDPLGRLAVAFSGDPATGRGQLRILNARTMKPTSLPDYELFGTNAAVLFADGRRLVYHDGTSGGEDRLNLHFVDLATGTRTSRHCADMLREFHVLRDGPRLFLFTHTAGLGEEGARLVRLDTDSAAVLAYAYPERAPAYAVPVLTRRYVVIAGSGASSARVRFYDREASPDRIEAQAVFVGPQGNETPALDLARGAVTHYGVAPGVASAGNGLAVGTPFGALGLRARPARPDEGG